MLRPGVSSKGLKSHGGKTNDANPNGYVLLDTAAQKSGGMVLNNLPACLLLLTGGKERASFLPAVTLLQSEELLQV